MDVGIFDRRHKDDALFGTVCLECLPHMTKWVYRLRDIDELQQFINKLGKVINDKAT